MGKWICSSCFNDLTSVKALTVDHTINLMQIKRKLELMKGSKVFSHKLSTWREYNY